MKTVRTKNRIKAFAVSFAVCLALIFGAVLSFGYRGGSSVSAAGDDTENLSETGIRFVQVAAGDDFAIGLTYDNRLFGWSLVGNDTRNTSAASLGLYYTSTPTEIDFKFRNGPGNSDTVNTWSGVGAATYHASTEDTIISIAATRTTAAFVTEGGYIYTWGRDTTKDLSGSDIYSNVKGDSGRYRYLLLREYEDNTYKEVNWYSPYIVNYNYYQGGDHDTGLYQMTSGYRFSDMSIAAGENNYIVVYKNNGSYYSYVWGSLLYAPLNYTGLGSYVFTTNTGGLYDVNDDPNYRNVYHTQYSSNTNGYVTAVAGGYTVGMNTTSLPSGYSDTDKVSSLTLKGKNFLTSVDMDVVSETTYAPVPTVLTNTKDYTIASVSRTTNGTSRISYSGKTFENAIIGGYYGPEGTNGVMEVNASTADLYYARQATSSSNITYGVTQATENSGINGSDNKPLVGDNFIIRNAVSLGNDIGYGISDGTLYAWGDNTQGQSGLNNNVPNYKTPTPTLAGKGRIVSVAAGKQISGTNKAFHHATLGEANETENTVAFDENVKNSSKYITGAINNVGKLYVWSDTHKEPEEIQFGNVDSDTEFVAVYSGYGRNIFAITELGKLVRITCDEDGTFSQTIYDYFIDKSGENVVNWTIGAPTDTSTNKSKVNFAIVYDNTEEDQRGLVNPEIGEITLYVNNAVATKSSISLDDTKATIPADADTATMYYGKSRNSLVSTNAAGDIYRILNPESDDYQIEYLAATAPATATASKASLNKAQITPKFSFKAKGANSFTAMTEKDQWSQLFEYEMVDDGNGNVGIKIKPKRSTQKGVVNVSFQVARYDYAGVYYDHLECNVEFDVDNTEVVRVYDSYNKDTGRSEIPLLDPNNDANKYYSLAVQDVSTGFTELSNFIAGDDAAAGTELEGRIISYVTQSKPGDVSALSTLSWDPGFPDVNKVEAGNLKYYLGSDAQSTWYNGTYKHLFDDRDLDVVKLTNVRAITSGNTSIETGIKSVRVRLLGLATGDTALTNKIPYNANIISDINKCFENIYGITDISITGTGTGTEEGYIDSIEFYYEIVLFTAKATSGRLGYGDAHTVDSFNTAYDHDNNIVLEFTLGYEEYVTFSADFIPVVKTATNSDKFTRNQNWQRAISAFSQASVRLKSNYTVGGKIVYGAAKDNDELGIVANNHIDIPDNTEHIVGDGDIVIPLSRFIEVAGAIPSLDYVTFSYNNQNLDFDKFNNQFIDSVSGRNYVTLTKESITVKLLSAHNIYFTVAIQRFYGTKKDGVFANGDERITLSFSFTNITQVSFTEPATSTQQNRTFNLDREKKVYVFGTSGLSQDEKDNAVNSAALVSILSQYRDNVVLTGLASSDPNIVKVTKDSNRVITVTPGQSGKAVVQFALTAFGKSIPITLTFNVAGVTSIKDKNQDGDEIDYTVNLSSVEYVYLSRLTTGLNNAVGDFINVSDYTVLYKDSVTKNGRNIFEGVYFERVGAAKDENDTRENKEKTPEEYYVPEFVRNIGFYDTTTTRAYLRIDFNSDASGKQLDGDYIVYVKFVDGTKYKENNTYKDAEGDTVLTAAFRLKANKSVASVDGAMLEIVADVDKPKKSNEYNSNSDWYMTGKNTEAKIYVPLEYLCRLVNIDNYNDYDIFLVSAAEEGSGKYINPVGGSTNTRKYIEITPLKNTKKPITLNVSITNPTKGVSENKVIAFSVSVKGISETLSKGEYTQIWLVAFFSSLGLLMVIFLIRMIVYWRRRAKQRALIKRNQELIKMRDRVHNKASSATREQAIRTKLKLQDPKYAKMFNEMKKDQNGGIGVTTVGMGDDISVSTGKKTKKKKGGKKSMAELKAELAAKKAAFAQAQAGGGDPFGAPSGDFGAPGPDFGAPAGDFGAPGPDFGAPNDMFSPSDLDGNAIIFDSPDIDGQA